MLAVTDITDYLRRSIPYTYVPNEFGTTDPDDCAYIRMTGGYAPSQWTTKSKPSFQIVLRAKSAKTADTKVNEIHVELSGKTEFSFGTTRIIKCMADQSTPLYLGKDANGRPLYSINFTVTTI